MSPDKERSHLGSRVKIDIFSIYSQTAIKLTNLDDPSTNATIELATPGESVSTVGLNTYAAGNTSSVDDLVTTGSETTVESIATSTPNGTLPPGTYEVAVHSEEGTATTTNATKFTLHGRSTNDVVAYTTDQESRSDLETAGAIRNATADGTLSPSSTVCANETVVYAVDATGLTGLPAARNVTLDTGAALDRFDGLSFGVRRTSQPGDAELAATATDDDIGSVPNRSSVHVDETGLYVVSNDENGLATDTDPSDGEEYTATFRVDDDRLRDASTDGSTGHAVTTGVTYVEPDTDSDRSAGGTDDTTSEDGTSNDGGANTDGGGTGGGGGTGSGGTGGAGGSAGSGTAGGGTPPDDPPTETATGN